MYVQYHSWFLVMMPGISLTIVTKTTACKQGEALVMIVLACLALRWKADSWMMADWNG